MPHCAAYNCTSRYGNKILDDQNRKVTFHRFPHGDEERLKEWLVQMRRKDFYPSKKAVICSKHFEDRFMYRFSATVRLREGAVPTIFDFPPYKETKKKHTTPSSITITTRSGKRLLGEEPGTAQESTVDSTPKEKTITTKRQRRNKTSPNKLLRKTDHEEIREETGSHETKNKNGLVSSTEKQNVYSTLTASDVNKRRSRKILKDGPPPPPSSTYSPVREIPLVSAPPEATNTITNVPQSNAASTETVIKVKQPRRRKILREGPPPSPPPSFTPVREIPSTNVLSTTNDLGVPVHFDGKDVLDYINVSRAAMKRKTQIFIDHSYAIMESPRELKQKLLDVTGALTVTKKKLKCAYQCNSRLKKRLSTLVLFIESLKNAEKNSDTFEILDDLETLMLDEPWVQS